MDDRTFTWTFKRPFGSAVFILGLPHGLVPMVPQELASTSFTEEMPENIGTGAYKLSEWDYGERVVLERNEDYQARSEPSSPGAYAGREHSLSGQADVP